MPFRETYEISNREEGKAAQRDQSYRSCVIALLIFFFLCLILIVACIPWKIRHLGDVTHNTDQYTGQESQHGEQTKQTTKIPSTRRITPITNTVIKTTGYINPVTKGYPWQDVTEWNIESSQNKITKNEIVRPPAIIPEEKTDRYTTKGVPRYTESAKKDFDLAMTQYENSTDLDESGIVRVDKITEDTEEASATVNPFTDVEESAHTEHIPDKHHHEESRFNTTINNPATLTSPIRPISEENRNTGEFATKYSDYNESMVSESYETIMTESSSTAEKYNPSIDEKVSPTMEIKNETKHSISGTSSYETTEKYNKQLTSDTMEKYSLSPTNNYTTTAAPSAFYNNTTITLILASESEMHIPTTEEIRLPDTQDTVICETGRCKQVASRMLSYMNHSADPCEDFYEYACGGFEANPQLVDDSETILRSRNYQRIARQMSKMEHEGSAFKTYYDSCVQYEKTMNFSERAKMASGTLSKIGKFYTSATRSNSHVNFTDLFTQLILHNSALLFDVVPELDEHSPNSFTLKIGPAMHESSFTGDHVKDPCAEDEFGKKEHYVDLQALYNDYKKCKYDTRELMKSIKEALTVFNVFKDVSGNDLEWHAQLEQIEKTVHIIDTIVMQEYFSGFQSKNEVWDKYSTNNYNKIRLEELENNCTLVNWTRLINSLGINEIDGNVQIYVHVALIEGLQKLESFGMKNPMRLNNAIMGLYAHKLYRELVLPRHDNAKDYCLRVATYLLALEASSLYISSFADDEIAQIDKILEDTFNELKQTLRLGMKKEQWAKGHERLLEKIDSLKLALPAVSYFQNRDLLYNEYNMSQIFLQDNYFNNSMILLERYRTLMYAELKGQVDDPKRIWTYYATPFQSQARVIYNLNLNVIPYGMIDWSLMKNEFSFNYLVLATLGNLIARQVAHHFDANGIYYWNNIKNPRDSLMYQNNFAHMNLEDYMDCQKNNLYQGPMNMTLPFSDQIVSFTIPQSTLNERLSDIMGLGLAYDTLVRTMSDAEEGLPWIKFRTEQLFYLAYAQTHCTKKPLASSYVSLYESENLPSRIRVFVAASNNKPLAEMWNCATGSQVAPIDVCSAFPHLDSKEATAFLAPQ